MGLDQYLYKKIYIGANYDHNNVTGEINIKRNEKPIKINFNRVTEIAEQIGYWRKCNQIHQWFVENCQKGVDDCGEYYVEHEKLKELLDTCKKVKDNHELANELLPPQEGFFFGSTEIDEYYLNDIDKTIEIIEDLFTEGIEGCDIYYRSSW